MKTSLCVGRWFRLLTILVAVAGLCGFGGCGDSSSSNGQDGGGSDGAGPSDGQAGDGQLPDGQVSDGQLPDGQVSQPIDDLDNVTLHLNLGDSMGAGYNADSGRGYAPMVHHNHSAYPAYAQHNLQALFAGCQFTNRASSGDTSDDVAGGQTGSLPASAGDTVVTIYVGGNDFNDNIQTMLLTSATQAAIDNWVANMTTVMNRLRNAYEDTPNGRVLTVLMATIHEPTDGTGTIPSQYTDGFCGTLQQVPAGMVQTVMDNYNLFNTAIRDFAAAQGAIVIDTQVLFTGHGLTVPPADQWLDTDCAHANNEGHHQVRREIWALLTGERY